jgi:hypothetical protein
MPHANQYRTEHVQDAPRGWRVKTLTTRTGHEVRLAFPPGPRKRGSGRLVSILHPHGENPESCNGPNRNANPSELLIMGLNPGKATRGHKSALRSSKDKSNPKLVTYDQAEAKQQKAIDFLERVDAEDPNDIAGMSVEEYAEHKGLKLKENPRKKSRTRKSKHVSPQATKRVRGNVAHKKRNPNGDSDVDRGVQLYEKFHGKSPEEIRELALRTEVQKTYVFGGELPAARFLQNDGKEWKISFKGDGVKLASSPDGKQLYCIEGNQNILSILKDQGCDITKDLITFGRWFCVYYLAAKSMTNFQVTEWEHYFGCVNEMKALMKQSDKEGWDNAEFQKRAKAILDSVPPLERDLPTAIYDALNKRILFSGGSYYVDWPGIIG